MTDLFHHLPLPHLLCVFLVSGPFPVPRQDLAGWGAAKLIIRINTIFLRMAINRVTAEKVKVTTLRKNTTLPVIPCNLVIIVSLQQERIKCYFQPISCSQPVHPLVT